MRTTTWFPAFDVDWSPFHAQILATASAEHFGLAGGGCVEIFRTDDAGISCVRRFHQKVPLTTLRWSESHDSQLLAGGGDGGISLLDSRTVSQAPIAHWRHHSEQRAMRASDAVSAVNSVSCSVVDRTRFCSGGNNGEIRVWDFSRDDPLTTMAMPTTAAVADRIDGRGLWSVCFHPRTAPLIACSGITDTVGVWDLRLDPRHGPALRVAAVAETLCVDWSGYSETVLATASADHALRVWDVRAASKGPTSAHVGHTLALLSVKFSPWAATELLTTSYDLSVARWDVSPLMAGALVRKWMHHTEFAQAAAWSPLRPDVAASVGWDRQLALLPR